MTGEVHFVDCGYSTTLMPDMDSLMSIEPAEEIERAMRKSTHLEAAQ